MSEAISLLTPQSCKPIRLGGLVSLTPADISHACMCLSGISYKIITVKYMSDARDVKPLVSLVRERMNDEAENEKWPNGRLNILFNMAVMEYCGTTILKDKDRAQYLTIHPSTFLRVWKKRYLRIMQVLEAYEQSALHMIRYRLKN